MRISIIGAGYVGLTTAVGFAKLGHSVKVVEVDKSKVTLIMEEKKSPIYEEGINELLKSLVPAKLSVTNSYSEGIANFSPDLIFICVGTPSSSEGSVNLSYLKQATTEIANYLSKIKNYVVIVVKSTVPPGTTENIVLKILESRSGKKAGIDFGVVMNPEFLREGKALYDFLHPDRIVIGYKFDKDFDIVKKAYHDISCPIVKVSLSEAEIIKYASNAFLATKISFINEIGNICKRLNIDVYKVAKGMGLDHRISPHFLNAGIGFGGSCFPKDVKALIYFAKDLDYNPLLLKSVLAINDNQPYRLVDVALEKLGSLSKKTIAVLGLAFKPGTDDIREAPSLKIVSRLIDLGANVIVYDPVAMNNAKKVFGEKVQYARSLDDILNKTNIVFILTEWDMFKDINLYKGKIVFDGRRTLDPKEATKVCEYEGVCW